MSRVGGALKSVRGRITLAATVLIAVTLTVASFAIVRLVENDLVASAEEALDDALAQAADVGAVSIDNRRFPVELEDEPFALGIFTIVEEDIAIGTLYDVDDEPIAELVVDVEEGELVEAYEIETGELIEDEGLNEVLGELVFDALEATDEEGALVVGAVELEGVDASLDAVRRALVVIVPILVLLAGAATWWLVGRALRPVHAISRRVDEISSSNLHERVPTPSGDDEIAELASVMNDMLDRIEQGSDRQRRFSADASHELRSPLSAIRAAAEMIERWPEGERVPGLAADIVAETDRMDQLIRDLLELSRLDEQRSTDAFAAVDLGELVDHVVAEVDTRGAVVTVRADEFVAIDGVARMLARLVRNLVANACRHADSEVLVTTAAANGGAVVAVHDDGGGVAEADRAVIFERFTRLDEARTRDAGGAGLGLALVRAIAEHHGGTVAVEESTDLGGAKFFVTLPAAPLPEAT